MPEQVGKRFASKHMKNHIKPVTVLTLPTKSGNLFCFIPSMQMAYYRTTSQGNCRPRVLRTAPVTEWEFAATSWGSPINAATRTDPRWILRQCFKLKPSEAPAFQSRISSRREGEFLLLQAKKNSGWPEHLLTFGTSPTGVKGVWAFCENLHHEGEEPGSRDFWMLLIGSDKVQSGRATCL